MFNKTKLTPAARKARTARLTGAAAFYSGAAASLAANLYASQHSPVGWLTGLWSPLALMLALELLERMPARGRAGLAWKAGFVFLALVAAWTSYWHLVHVFDSANLDVVSVYSMPLTVDILMAFGRAAMLHKAPAQPSVRRPAAKPKAKVERTLKAV